MNTFRLLISTPDGEAFNDSVMEITLRGAEGDLTIMAGHTPFITSVKKGVCKIILSDNTPKTANIDGGLLTVSKEKVVLLSGNFSWE